MYSSTLTEVENILSDGRSKDSFARCESASLRLEKFVHIGDNSKKDEIAAVVSRPSQKIPEFLPPKALRFRARLGGRLIVNQAGGILENAGLCLHPHFNAPYIPGSALKGAARHAAWCAWNDEKDDSRKLMLSREIAEIFGYPTGDKSLDTYLESRGCGEKRSGSVCFMPAYPESTARLVSDIVNCHHPKYYSGDEDFGDAADIESPIPNFFPAVEAGSHFVFALVPVRGGNVERAKAWLVEALTCAGVGAKTAAGYGWFEYDPVAEEAAEKKRRDEIAKRLAEKLAEKIRAEQRAAADARRAARAAMTLEERWQEQNVKSICKGPDILGFTKMTDERKREMVALFQNADMSSIGAQVWKALRLDKKLRNQPVVDAVFKFAKDNKLGRMPQ